MVGAARRRKRPVLPARHQLDGFACVFIEVASEPVGGVLILWEVLEDLHERPWEDACGSLRCALGEAGRRGCFMGE